MAENVSICKTDKVQDIFDAIQAKYEPVTMFRLGRKIEGKSRPLMVRLISEDAKNTLFSKLSRLKYATRRYNEKISITHDYTREERRTLKDLVKEAKNRNTIVQNERYRWKAHGMEIIRMPLRAQKEGNTHKEHFIEAHEGLRS